MLMQRQEERAAAELPIADIIRDLARSVPKGAQLQHSEAILEGIRRQRDANTAEQRDLIAKFHGSQHAGASQAGRRLSELESERLDLEAKISAHRQEVSKLRAARARKVLQALAPSRSAAARDMISAIELLNAATDRMVVIAEEVRRAGDPDQPYMRVPDLADLYAIARRFAEGCS